MFLASGCAITNTPLPELPPVRTLTLNPATLPDAFESSPYPSQFLSTVGGVPPLSSCTVVAGTFPAGLGLRVNASNRTQCEIFTQTPPGQVTQAPGTYRFTIRAADSSAPLTDTEDYTIIVRPGFAINAFTLENGTEGRAFSQTITTTLAPGRGIPPLLANPNGCVATGLPAGLSISRNPADTNGCVISGTPAAGSAAGSPYMVSVTLTDSGSPANIRMAGPIALTINPPLVMPAFALANGTQNRAYGPFTVTTTGGQPPVTCADGGTLPTGMGVAPSADGRNCVISGTPTVNGNFNVTISATDTATATTGTATVSQTVALVVNAPLDITSLMLANGTVGRAYMGQLTNSGGQTPFAWSNPGGDLAAGACAGLSVNAAGMVTGTPTTAGTCVFTARVDDTMTTTTAAGFDQDSVTITVNLALTITTLNFANGTVGRAFNAQFASTGGEAPFTWTNPGGDISAGACAGLALSAAGALTGTPTTAGVCMFTARVDDSGTATTPASFDQQTITINVNAALQITSLALGNGTVGRPFTQGMTNTGGQTPYTWTNPGGDLAAGACAGLAIAANGAVTGTPTTAGVCMFTGRVDDTATATTAAGFDQQTISITVNATLMITTASPLPDGVQNRAFNLLLTLSGGNAPFTWSSNIGSVVACNGLNLAADGTLSGTPATAGACMFTAQVDDTASTSTAAGNAMTAFTVTIQPPLVVTLTQLNRANPNLSLFDGVLGRSYGEIASPPTWNVTGGLGGYSWCVFTGPASIPGGMVGISTDCGAPNAAAGVTLTTGGGGSITGATGVFNFTVRVFDTGNAATAGGFANNATLINVNPALIATENVGARVGNDITIPDAVEGRPYGNAPVDPTRVDYTMSASGGLAPYALGSAFVGGTTPPTPFFCFQTPGTWTCHSSDGPINVGGAAASPFIFDLTFTDTGNSAVPNASVTVQHTLNTRVALAVAANMAPPDAVQGRTYGQNPLTPLVYTASGGLSATGVNFTVPANQAGPGAGFPNGFACTPSALMLTCGAAVSVTGTQGVYGPFNVVVDDTANATTPSSATSTTSGAVAVTLNVNAPLTMPAVALANGTQDRVFGPVNLPFTGGLTGFSCAGAGLPTGMTVTGPVASACQLNNTPTVNGAFTPSATVTDTANASTPSGIGATGNMALTLNAPLAITSVDPLPAAVSGGAYIGFTFTNSGGQTPFTWSNPGGTPLVTLNTLDTDCAGLSMNAAGMISGTATAASGGTCTFTARVDDTATATTAAGFATGVFNIAIVDSLQVVPFAPGNGTQDRAFSIVVSVVGGDGTLRTDPNGCTLAPGSGALPNGVTFVRNPGNTNTCLLSGTPTVANTFANITVRISDQPGSTADFGPFSIVINQPLSLATFTLQDGTEGRAYGLAAGGAFQIAITGGEAPYTCSSSTLPSGVSVVVNGTNCDVSGTPNTGDAAAGPYTGTITVMDTLTNTTAAGSFPRTSGAPFNINVPLQFDTAMGLPDSVVGLNYNLVLQASGGQAPRSFSQVIGSALSNDTDCVGLTFSAPSGTLGGAPTGASPVDNVCSFTAQVVDTATANSAAAGLGTVTRAFTIQVQPALNIDTTTLPNARRTSTYFPTGLPGAAIVASGGTGSPTTWTVTSGNFTLNAGNWEGNAGACVGLSIPQAGTPLNTVVTGTPTTAGTCNFTIQVADQGSGATGPGMDSQALSILVLDTLAYLAGNSTASVEVINTETNGFVTSIGIGGGTTPDQVAVSQDGRFVVVTSPGNDQVIVIDASDNSIVGGMPFTVGPTCDEPRGVATNDLVGIGPRAYITCAQTDNVVAIDINPANIGTTFGDIVANVAIGGTDPLFIAFTPDGTTAYVTNSTSDTFTPIDATTDTTGGDVAFTNFGCSSPRGVVISPDGLRGFIVCNTDRKVVVIDTDSGSVDFNTDIANTTTDFGSTGAASPNHIAITPDGARLYITLGSAPGGLPEMAIVTVAGLGVTASVGVPYVGGAPSGLTAGTSPFGVTIPPGSTVKLFVVMSAFAERVDNGDDVSPGVAVFTDSPFAAVLTAPVGPDMIGNPPIVFSPTTMLPRGIAHIPIPR